MSTRLPLWSKVNFPVTPSQPRVPWRASATLSGEEVPAVRMALASTFTASYPSAAPASGSFW